MRWWAAQGGQVLVETALVLPILVLFAVVFLYVFLVCRQMLRLQPAAADMALLAATSDDPLALHAMQTRWLAESMGGRATPPVSRRESTLLPEWRKAHGFSVTNAPGRVLRMEFNQMLLPHACGAFLLPVLHWITSAEMPMEPPIPPED